MELKQLNMKVKIIKCNKPQSWYRGFIGKIFEVLETNEDQKHYVVHKGRLLNSYIDFDDCEVLIEGCKEGTTEGSLGGSASD